MVSTTTRTTTETPVRWAKAAERAIAKKIQVFQDPTTGDFLALSSDATKLYTVRWYTCTCAAAEAGDPVCIHRAAFRAHCKDEDRQVEKLLREQELGMTDAELEALLAAPTFPYDPAEVERLITEREVSRSATAAELEHRWEQEDAIDVDDSPSPWLGDGTCRTCGGTDYVATEDADRCTTCDPVTEAVTVLVARCSECLGTGMGRMYTGGGLNDYWSVHCACPAGMALLERERMAYGVAA